MAASPRARRTPRALFLASLALPACSRPDPHPPAAAAAALPVAPPALGYDTSAPTPAQGELTAVLRAEAARARAMGLTPVAFFHASWCRPCRAVEASMGDPRMIDAFRGTHVIELDVDLWDWERIRAQGFAVPGIPTWIVLDEAGRPTARNINSGAWGPDVPENMAPVLKQFFAGRVALAR